jgi:P-type Mg2+ transporter
MIEYKPRWKYRLKNMASNKKLADQNKNLDQFWTMPLIDVFNQLKATPLGLKKAEIDDRRRTYGANIFGVRSQKSLFILFAQRFRNPLIILLFAASLISAIVHDYHSAILIFIMVTLSISIDSVQEYRASSSALKLKKSVALRSTVLRDKQKLHIPAEELVPGDVVYLSAGDLIPADGRLLHTKDLFVNQSLLTGESYPVEKNTEDVQGKDASLTAATNAVFMGTSVLTGDAQFMVCNTGQNTALGEVAATLSSEPPPTAFELGTRQFGFLLMKLILFLVLFVILANTIFFRPWLDTILFALALGVGLAPEFLPMVVSITLARGAVRMSHKQVIVKRLSSIHDLGSMNVLCTDKTGTLTEAKIQLADNVDLQGKKSEHVLTLAYLNSFFETGLKSPLDEAILEHTHVDASSWEKIDEIPFDFERRRVSVLVDDGKRRLLIVKGAPEDVLRVSTHFEDETNSKHPKTLGPKQHLQITKQFESISAEGMRALGIAWREVPKTHSHAVIHDESGLTFAGFSTFYDPPKATSGAALQQLNQIGVAIKVITGDNELVTKHLCEQLKIPITGLLNGSEIDKLSDQALMAAIKTTNVFCRVNPVQKNRIIGVVKKAGFIVGYMGDGINDAPSLHNAHVSISVDTAVDVAKDAADIILLKQNLHVVYEGVIEGRVTYGNIMKYIMMMTSSNFGNMISMAGAALFLPFLPMLPSQILLNNLLYDVSEIAIPLDNVDKGFLQEPHRWKMSFIRNFMFLIGPISSIFDFATFYILLKIFDASESLFQTGWFVESLATQILVIFIIRTKLSPFKSFPNAILAISSLSLVCIGMILPFTPMGPYFKFVHLPGSFFVVLGGLIITYLCLAEAGKRVFYRYLG